VPAVICAGSALDGVWCHRFRHARRRLRTSHRLARLWPESASRPPDRLGLNRADRQSGGRAVSQQRPQRWRGLRRQVSPGQPTGPDDHYGSAGFRGGSRGRSARRYRDKGADHQTGQHHGDCGGGGQLASGHGGYGSLSVPDGAVATRGKDNIARNRHAAPSLRQMVTQRAPGQRSTQHPPTLTPWRAQRRRRPRPINGSWHFTATPCR